MFLRIRVLKSFRIFTEKHPCLFNKVADLKAQYSTQVFSSEICEIFKNNFFNRTPSVAACVYLHASLMTESADSLMN